MDVQLQTNMFEIKQQQDELIVELYNCYGWKEDGKYRYEKVLLIVQGEDAEKVKDLVKERDLIKVSGKILPHDTFYVGNNKVTEYRIMANEIEIAKDYNQAKKYEHQDSQELESIDSKKYEEER